MNLINEKAMVLKQGEIRAMFEKAKLFNNVISLGIGEPDLDTPKNIVEAGCKALNNGKTHYTPNAGIIGLRQEISKNLEKFGINSNPDKEIIVTTGAMGSLSMCLMVMINEGDEVLIQDPQWLNYYSQVKFVGGVAVPIPVYEKNSFKLVAKDIRDRITDKTKIIMINTPNNPTGAVLDYNDLREIADIAIENDLFIISDEVYSTLIYDGRRHISIASIEGMRDRVITINSFSKSFAMTGWRIGYAAGNEMVIDKMTRLQENLVACVNEPAQYAAIEALRNFDISENLKNIFESRRNHIVKELNSINGLSCTMPSGGFYVFLNIKATQKTSSEFANELLENKKVVTIPGSAFGKMGEGYVRIAYTLEESKLLEAVARIGDYVGSLIKE
ncbi:MAG: pyridoxal phosphate-dependent aminotransferase [Gudongella sp.]|nr:pyridoxal phosphate-dependent aminotransferase [Gudongella sp.]